MSQNNLNPGDTVSRYVNFTDVNGNYFDPDSITCQILDPTGAVQGTPTLTKIAVGQYTLDWNIPSNAVLGVWKIIVTATSGSYKESESYPFVVQPL